MSTEEECPLGFSDRVKISDYMVRNTNSTQSRVSCDVRSKAPLIMFLRGSVLLLRIEPTWSSFQNVWCGREQEHVRQVRFADCHRNFCLDNVSCEEVRGQT